MHEVLMFKLAGISLIAMGCQWLAWRVGLPAILFLLMAGVVAGPVTGWLVPEQAFGQLLLPIISLSVAIILFEGSLTLKFQEIRGLQVVVRRLVTTGVLTTWAIITLASHWLLNFSWKLSLLFGAITVVTGPTVIAPMLRTIRPTARIANILRWEGIVIDPVGALLGVLVFQFVILETNSESMGQTLIAFFNALAMSSLIGVAAGYAFGHIIRNHWLPEYLHNLATLALVLGVFVVSNTIQHESGLLAVTVMGVCLANMKGVPMKDILNFKENLSILLISGLFIILAARINFTRFVELGWGAVGVLLAIQFVAGPMRSLLASWGTTLDWRERVLIGWIAPRGIVAAATAAVFAARLQDQGYEAASLVDTETHLVLTTHEYVQAELLVPLTFMVIITTVVLQGITARFLAARLGVAQPEPRGFLLVGANALARAIAMALRDSGFEILLADTNWNHIRAARMEGLTTYYGNITSEHASHHLDIIGIGTMLALSEYPDINHLACERYRGEFGRKAIYSIQTEEHRANGGKSRFAPAPEARILFGANADIHSLLEMLESGGKVCKTVLSEQHDYPRFVEIHHGKAVPLMAITPKGAIQIFSTSRRVTPQKNWTVLALVPREAIPHVQGAAD